MNAMKTTLADVKALSNGKWGEILPALGVPPELLDSRKHHACPSCGGKDRFRFTDYQGKGNFICNQCTPEGGSGFDLLVLVHGYGFNDAWHAVAGVLGLGNGQTPAHTVVKRPVSHTAAQSAAQPAQPTGSNQAARLRRIWAECQAWRESPLLAAYFRNRGLTDEWQTMGDDVRFHAALPYWHNGQELARLPCMVGLYRKPDDSMAGLHFTYLQTTADGTVSKARLLDPASGEVLPAKKMRAVATGSMSGAALRLHQPQNGVIGVAEGLETALAAYALSGVSMWACGSAVGMKNLLLPRGFRALRIFADNDANHTSQEAAAALQRRYHERLNGNIAIATPADCGRDWLDVLTDPPADALPLPLDAAADVHDEHNEVYEYER